MKPTVRLGAATTPDGGEMVLCRHDGHFSLTLERCELMNSRAHESELELARAGCGSVAARADATVLIGGLGMGYTLRQALDMLKPEARVMVAELMPEVVRWNREFMGGLTHHPLRDPRVVVQVCDVVELIRESDGAFDAILLDVDNGPDAMAHAGNVRLYGREGIRACLRALRTGGCLAIWSAAPDTGFERLLRREGLHFRLLRAPAHRGGRTGSRFIWVIARDAVSLPHRNRGRG